VTHYYPNIIECDVLPGLEEVLLAELEEHYQASRLTVLRAGTIQADWVGNLQPLCSLRSALAAYQVFQFAIPRPRALLGHQYFSALVAAINTIRAMYPAGSFATLRISAAGEDSSVLQRLREELANTCGLVAAPEEADLLMRLRRSPTGWDMLIRLSPRPLATRSWRACNYAGAPNASLAHAMAWMTHPRPTDIVLNLCCGSGTLLIERLLLGRAAHAIGCDTNPVALACAQENLQAAGLANQVRLELWDATNLPLADASVDVIFADLPFGQLSGSHRENELLYPRILAEAARIAMPHAWMVLLTHELRLLEQTIGQFKQLWQLHQIVRVRSSGMTPGIFVFERNSHAANYS
jgi:tRNA (guanine6-N2)-methyltransferase